MSRLSVKALSKKEKRRVDYLAHTRLFGLRNLEREAKSELDGGALGDSG